MEKLIFPKDMALLRQYKNVIDPDVFLDATETGDYFDWAFAKEHYKKDEDLRSLVKKNFQEIEKQCVEGKCGFLKTSNDVEPYMDQEIIDFLLYLSLKYLKALKEWQYRYLDESNGARFMELLHQMDFRQKVYLYKTNLDKDIINQVLLSGDLGDFPLFKMLKLKNYYQDKMYQSTIDQLVLRYEIKTKEELMSIRIALSEEGWKIAKARYMSLVESEIQ